MSTIEAATRDREIAHRERVYRAAETEHDQVLIAIKNFTLDAFMRGEDRAALIGRDMYRMLDDLRARRLEAVRQSLGLPERTDATKGSAP